MFKKKYIGIKLNKIYWNYEIYYIFDKSKL